MKIKVSELTGPALNWVVAQALGEMPEYNMWSHGMLWSGIFLTRGEYRRCPNYSTEWAQGGPIIEEERIAISYDHEWVYDPADVDPDDEPDNGDRWYAEIRTASHTCTGSYGPTLLIAAMRCLVHSQLGEEVEVPEELT